MSKKPTDLTRPPIPLPRGGKYPTPKSSKGKLERLLPYVLLLDAVVIALQVAIVLKIFNFI